MADHASALKRHRQSLKRKARNKTTRSKLQTLYKNVVKAASKEDALKVLKNAIRAFAKAGHKNILHPKTASRRISLLTRTANAKA